MAIPPDEILSDFKERYAHSEVDPAFERLYDRDGEVGRMLASFHQRLNSYFDFMNEKIKWNRHVNAEQSRGLIRLIEEISDAQEVMKSIGHEFRAVDYYEKLIDDCRGFLIQSGGSPMPQDFKRITTIRYRPAFLLTDTEIQLPEGRESAKLKMIGSGSYANVFSYRDPAYDTLIAVKRAKRELDAKEIDRFRREFDVLKSLRFPYVLEVFKYDKERTQYTMEYCDSTLREFIVGLTRFGGHRR